MKRLPKANNDFGKLTDTKLIIAALSLQQGLANHTGIFPDPPIGIDVFPDKIENFRLACADAVKGSKQFTNIKATTKQDLINCMRAEVEYVNVIIQRNFWNTPYNNYPELKKLVYLAGLQAEKIVGRPNTLGNVRKPITLSSIAKDKGKVGANVNGVLKVRVQIPVKYQTKAVKTWWLQYRLKAIPANPWSDYSSTTTRIQVTDIDAGIYQYRIAGVPGIFMGKDQLNWSPIQETVVT